MNEGHRSETSPSGKARGEAKRCVTACVNPGPGQFTYTLLFCFCCYCWKNFGTMRCWYELVQSARQNGFTGEQNNRADCVSERG